MKDTSWLARSVMEKVAQTRAETGESGAGLTELTPREIEVLGLIAEGGSNEQIERAPGLKPPSVRNCVTNIYGKIGAKSRAEAVGWATEGLAGM